MDINVTYHWTHLEYSHPMWKHHDTWGPVARITIMAKLETPFVKEQVLWGSYDVFDFTIEGNDVSPCDQILKRIQEYAAERNIEIQMDFLEKWEKKNPDSSGWDEAF